MTARRGPETPPEGPAECPAVEVRFPSCAEYLSLVRSIVEWFASRCSFGAKERARIVLSVVEATTNIIRHAYGGDPNQLITLCLRRLEDRLEIEFLDRGSNISTEGLVEKRPGRLEPGGLGVRLMKSCMDEFEYQVRPEGGARLVLRKRLEEDGPGGGPRGRRRRGRQARGDTKEPS